MIRLVQNCKWFLIVVLIGLPMLVQGQEGAIVISGKILAAKDSSIVNATVSLEGVSATAYTDENGEFSIEAPEGEYWMLINPLGNFQQKKVFLNDRRPVVIYLASKDMDSYYNMAVTPSGFVEKRNIVTAFTDLSTDDILKVPYETVDQYFQGRVAGLNVINHSGMPGDGALAYIRGIGSMNTNIQPLYVIDGMIFENAGLFTSQVSGNNNNPLTSLEPQDITNITVLKDASATALYGIKGSNGVIIIEILKPTEKKTTIDFTVRVGISFRPDSKPVLNSTQFKSLANEVLLSGNFGEESFYVLPGLYDDKYSKEYLRYNNETDWQNEVFENTSVTDINFNVKGGDAIAKYGLSVGYLNHKGIIKNTDYSRFNVRFVGTFNIVEWLRMYITTSLSYNNSNLMDNGLNIQTSPIYSSLFKAPMMYPYQYNSNGQVLPYLDDVSGFGVSNPTAVVTGYGGVNEKYRLISTVRLEGDVSNSIKWNGIFGVNLNRMREQVYWPNQGMASYLDGEAINVIKHQTDQLYSMYIDNNFTFHKVLNNGHGVSVKAGVRTNVNRFEEDLGFAMNAPESDEYRSLNDGASISADIAGSAGKWNWLSFYGNVEYSFRDKYLLGGVVSVDGSSRIGKLAETGTELFGYPFGIFPAAQVAWRLSSENFMKNISWLEEFKLRGSYGLSGNDDIGNYNSRSTYTPIRYRGTSGLYITSIPNESLTFETNVMLNAGADLSLFGEKLNVHVDYFERETRDMLIFERQASYSGYEFTPTNGGNVMNKGYEIAASVRLINNKNFKWDIGGNLAHYSNEVTNIQGGSLVTDIQGGQIISRVGDPVNSYYGYVAEGVYQSSAAVTAAGLVNDKGVAYKAGDVKYRDLSGENGVPDGKIDQYDKTVIGNPNPDYYGGVFTALSYKRWSVNALTQFSVGNDAFNYVRYQTEKMTDLSNQSSAVLNRWQHEGQITSVPRALYNDPIGNTDFSTRWIEEASYLRLKELSFAYTIPTIKNNKAGLTSFQVYITGTNLFTYTNYLGYDPEFSYSSSPAELGVDYGQMPQARSILLGVKIGL